MNPVKGKYKNNAAKNLNRHYNVKGNRKFPGRPKGKNWGSKDPLFYVLTSPVSA
jgi:hypothetical protein